MALLDLNGDDAPSRHPERRRLQAPESKDVVSNNTDEVPASEDEQAKAAARRLGSYLNEDWGPDADLRDLWDIKRGRA